MPRSLDSRHSYSFSAVVGDRIPVLLARANFSQKQHHPLRVVFFYELKKVFPVLRQEIVVALADMVCNLLADGYGTRWHGVDGQPRVTEDFISRVGKPCRQKFADRIRPDILGGTGSIILFTKSLLHTGLPSLQKNMRWGAPDPDKNRQSSEREAPGIKITLFLALI